MKFRIPAPMELRFRRNNSYWKSIVFGVFLTIFWLPEVILHATVQGLSLIVIGLWDILCSVIGELASFAILLGAGVAGNVDIATEQEREQDAIDEDGDE